MKPILSLFLLFISLGTSFSQEFIHAFEEDFSSPLEKIELLSNGEILVAGIRGDFGTTNYNYEIYLKRLDTSGNILSEKVLTELVYETAIYITDLQAFPDGGYGIVGIGGGCDYFEGGFFFRFDADDNITHSLNQNFPDAPPYYSDIFLMPNNEYALNEGDLIEVYNNDNQLVNEIYPEEFNNERIGFINENELIFIKEYSQSIHDANTFDLTVELPFAYEDIDDFASINYTNNSYLLIEEDKTLIIKNYSEIIDEIDSDEILGYQINENHELSILFENPDNTITFKMYDADLNSVMEENKIIPEHLEITDICVNENQLFIAGYEYSGRYQTTGFLHSLPLSENTFAPQYDLEITGLSMNDPVFTEIQVATGSNQSYEIYFFENIEISVQNNSDEVINNFNVSTLFNFPIEFICGNKISFTHIVQSVDLMPNATTVIEIPELIGYNNNPNDFENFELCFWVNAPNNETDLVFENDLSCIQFERFYEINSTNDIALTQDIDVFPNPASDFISLDNFAEIGVPESYCIMDFNGRIIQQGMLTNEESINISALNSGLFFLEIRSKNGINIGKFVKENN